MNDIFHERHMNNIIAADREQNIHGAPDSLDAHRPDNRSGPKGPQRSLGSRSRRWRTLRAGWWHLKFLAVSAANPWKNVNSRTAPGSVSDRHGISPGSNRARVQSAGGATPGRAANESLAIGAWSEIINFLVVLLSCEVTARMRAPRLLCRCEREKQTWSMLMAVSSGTS